MASRRRKRRRSPGILAAVRAAHARAAPVGPDRPGPGRIRGLLRVRLLLRLGRRRGGRGDGRRHPLPVRRGRLPGADRAVRRGRADRDPPDAAGGAPVQDRRRSAWPPRSRSAWRRARSAWARATRRATASSTPTTCASTAALVGESLFWASAKLFSERRVAHPVRLPAAGRRAAAHRRLDRGRGAGHARRGHHHRRARPAHDATSRGRHRAAARRSDAGPEPVEPPEPEDQEPVVRATHVEAPALDASERYPDLYGEERARAGAADEPWDEPEPELEPSRSPSPTSRPRGARAGGADADGQPPLGGHRGRRLRLPHAQAVLPEALQRRPEGRHQGHRAHRRPAGRGAQPLQRRGARDRHGHRPARDALRAAPGARASRCPRSPSSRTTSPTRSPPSRCASSRRSRASRRSASRCPTACARWCTSATSSRTRRRAGRRCRSGSARTSPARRSAPTSPSSRTS